MRWKLAAVVGTAAAGLVVAAPFAMADETEGGHCEYGDFSVNVEPSCDTNEGGAELTRLLNPNFPAEPVHDSDEGDSSD
jgi:hypothetical protein